MSLLTACNLSNSPATPDTGTPIVMVITATPSDTPPAPAATTAPAPSATPTPSETATDAASPTLAASATNTQPPTITPTASLTPLPTIGFRYDNWDRVALPAAMQGGATKPLVIFTNTNDQETITSLATARPENERLLVYAVDPDFPDTRITLLELNAATGTRIYPSASGKGLAYFRDGSTSPGLYILNLADGLSGRVAAINSLVQRGIYSPPAWSADGEQLAVTLATPYDLDIFLYARDGSKRDPLPDLNTGAYEFYPAFSPDGRSIAFVSDRAACPSWTPGVEGACDAHTTASPLGGQVYVMDVESKTVRQISEAYVTEPPTWINNTLLAFAVGDGQDLLKPERELWLANIPGETTRQIALSGDTDGLYLSDVWSPDGSKVLFQYVTPSEARLVMMNTDGTIINERSEDLVFPRYGLRAAWSPLDERIALGGTTGECPYGMRVMDEGFEYVSRGNASPTMCNPIFSPNGRFIAFAAGGIVRAGSAARGRPEAS
ncbi:hypothetical protein HC776_03100 [bacterium]|nr:hypothetical protein [bacterium]